MGNSIENTIKCLDFCNSNDINNGYICNCTLINIKEVNLKKYFLLCFILIFGLVLCSCNLQQPIITTNNSDIIITPINIIGSNDILGATNDLPIIENTSVINIPNNITGNITTNSENETVIQQIKPIINKPTPINNNEIQSLYLMNAVVIANNIKAGNTGTFQVTLKNTSNINYPVKIYYSKPDSTRQGYVSLNNTAIDWITINPNIVNTIAKSESHALVTLKIPNDIIFPSDKMEFWLTYEYNTGGSLSYTYNQRWLLTTKE
jgi:hypothetical protein